MSKSLPRHAQTRFRRVLAAATATAVLSIAMAPGTAFAAPIPGSGNGPDPIDLGGQTTVTLTLDGESTIETTPTDVVFVVDESGSIDSGEHSQMATFNTNVLAGLVTEGLFTNGGRAGIVKYSDDATTQVALTTNQAQLDAAFPTRLFGGLTYTNEGIDLATSMLGADPSRNLVMITLTDGFSNDPGATSTAAANARAQGIVTYAVGVAGANAGELGSIAGDPSRVFSTADFAGLADLVDDLVAGVTLPGATHASVTATLSPEFVFAAAPNVTASKGSAAIAGNQITWDIGDLGDENATLSYTVAHAATTCGTKDIHSSIAYTDDQGAAVGFAPVTVEVTGCPTISVPDASVPEGSTVALTATATNYDTITWADDAPAIGSLLGTSGTTVDYAGLDDGADQLTVSASRTVLGGTATAVATPTVTVTNVAPDADALTLDTYGPVPVGTPVTASFGFTDPGAADTFTAHFDWGDATSSDVALPAGSTSGSGSHAFTAAGLYWVSATVTDDDGGSDSVAAGTYVVVYDPSAGFVTGGGWINSPAGAYTPDPTLTGKATFGFVSKYHKGATTPSGNTEFQFQAGSLNFKSTGYDWLVVAGNKAIYKGAGTVNGVSGYTFLLTAEDSSPDRFRIKITDAADAVVYDSNVGGGDDAAPATAISQGQIIIHK